MHPDSRATSAYARVFSPTHHKRLSSTKLGADDELQMGERSILDLNFHVAFIDELAHVFTAAF